MEKYSQMLNDAFLALMLKSDLKMNYRGAEIEFLNPNGIFTWQHPDYIDASYNSEGLEYSTGYGVCSNVIECMYQIDELLDKEI
jgi:hypothetical protein